MLSEKEAISILEANSMKPNTLPIQGQRALVAELNNGYSFIIKQDESMLGSLCACLHRTGNGDLIVWNKIDTNSLKLAIKNVQEFLGIEPKRNLHSDRIATVTVAFVSLLISTGYLFGNKLAYCNALESEVQLRDEQLSIISEQNPNP